MHVRTKVAVKGDVGEGSKIDVEDAESSALFGRAVKGEHRVLCQEQRRSRHARVPSIADVNARAILGLVSRNECAVKNQNALQVLEPAAANEGAVHTYITVSAGG